MCHGRKHDHGDQGGGTIDHPRAYEALAAVILAGRRRRMYTRMAELSGVRPGDRVLDVGCGTGYLTRLVAPRVGPGGRVTGLDASAPMIEYARRRAPGDCSYVVGEGQDMPLPDSSFDVVVSSFAVHHIPASARAATVREMFRVLRPGGRLLIAEFRPPRGHAVEHVLNALFGPALRTGMRELLPGLCAEAGFQVERVEPFRPVSFHLVAVRPAADREPANGPS
ncbi:methyltransferase domain-containing protein [Sphaerisporangium aureirubrum]|uniref:Methyltransferase domain-containing protein n=1 Tax=Sphaerisporangium aureirubrum TaxID=1544736 RepID=A0ABW1NKR7_9ACTN